ncbi:conserved exported hypothetical protein [Candidatus Nitrotoga sp. HW29]|uniref:hypothetical protein n=1 Tax=Candidatus Nitrotoga sp. HW29 TaxID=2886963 RepID=UPI001EF2818D|nr:hypothetical protein [Candidatus Nitrotoga sp. HW29]CAH1903987.1 conserved exported hypothetical protein [Candidatus Nitrotoga sp. HW29]
MSPGIKIRPLQAAAIAVLVMLVDINFTRPANAATETKDSQTELHMSDLPKNKKSGQSYSSYEYGTHGKSQSPIKITDPYSPYGNPYSNTPTNNPYALQVPVNKAK